MHEERRASFATRLKNLLMILCAQAACLGVGLWMQHQFLHSSAREEAVDSAWADLAQEASNIAQEFRAVAETDGVGQGSDLSQVVRSIPPPTMASGFAFIVDARWRVVTDWMVASGGRELVSAGDRISWKPAGRATDAASNVLKGLVTFAGQEHLASAVTLPSVGGTLVVARPVAPIERRADAMLGSLPIISGLTFVWTCALLSISAYMILSRFYDESEHARARSVAEGLRQRQELVRTRDAVVFGLAKLADSRDPETGDHLERISVYTTTFAAALRHHPRFGRQVTPAFIRLIGISSVLHDIGKVGIADRILLKEGPLTPDERRIIQGHAVIGGECLRGIERRLGSSNFLEMAREIAFAHHERWDGTGYPRGLAGEEIPLSARIVAIADVYDALASQRIYKEPQSHQHCEEIIRSSGGTHFDPDLVDAWLAVAPRFAEIALRYASPRAEEPARDDDGSGSAITTSSQENREVGPQSPGERAVLLGTAPAGPATRQGAFRVANAHVRTAGEKNGAGLQE